MKIRNYFPAFKDEGEVVALFGQARLIKFLNGKYELRGGSKADHLEAREWISLFCHDVVIQGFHVENGGDQPRRCPLVNSR